MDNNCSKNNEVEHRRIQSLVEYRIINTPQERAFDRIVSLAAIIFRVPIVLINFVDADRLWIKAHIGIASTSSLPREATICAHAIQQSGLLVVNGIEDPVYQQFGHIHEITDNLQFYAAMPLQTAKGYNIGTLCILDTQPRVLSDDDQQIMQHLAALVIDELDLRLAIEQRQQAEQLSSVAMNDAIHARMLATTDALTRLSNRRAFEEDGEFIRLCVATGRISDTVVVMLDVDGLKAVNDTYGHQAGDRLLQTFAECLSEQFRLDDRLYRIGGDEYALVLTSTSIAEIASLPERLRDVVARVRERIGVATVDVSVGAASLREVGCQWGTAVRLADERMVQTEKCSQNALKSCKNTDIVQYGRY